MSHLSGCDLGGAVLPPTAFEDARTGRTVQAQSHRVSGVRALRSDRVERRVIH